MEEDYNNVFPRFIDKPRLIGIFEMDEFFLSFGIMTATIVVSFAFPAVDSLIVMIIALSLGLGFAVMYKKFKENRPNGYTMQKLYRLGIFSPTDDKKGVLKYKYLKKLGRVIPYGFTRVFFN